MKIIRVGRNCVSKIGRVKMVGMRSLGSWRIGRYRFCRWWIWSKGLNKRDL